MDDYVKVTTRTVTPKGQPALGPVPEMMATIKVSRIWVDMVSAVLTAVGIPNAVADAAPAAAPRVPPKVTTPAKPKMAHHPKWWKGVWHLHSQGLSGAHIARLLGRPECSVHNALRVLKKEVGVQMNPQVHHTERIREAVMAAIEKPFN